MKIFRAFKCLSKNEDEHGDTEDKIFVTEGSIVTKL